VPLLQRPDGAEVWWDAAGPADGDPVVLVMGLAYPSDSWFRVRPALEERYRVARIDNRGAGRTGFTAGAPYTVETMTGDVLAVMDAAGFDAAHIISVSMGGLIAQELALQAPERVRSLVLG
jgi:pimeloyl-ACP methyl ester carboxylesterase